MIIEGNCMYLLVLCDADIQYKMGQPKDLPMHSFKLMPVHEYAKKPVAYIRFFYVIDLLSRIAKKV